MALISIIKDFHPLNDSRLLNRAAELTPVMHHEIVRPAGAFRLRERYSSEREVLEINELANLSLGKQDNLCLDFGTHHVGYVTLELSCRGSHPDAPALIKLKFAETEKELSEKSDDYDGWISRSWIQEETIHIDELPAKLSLPRRYAFRYLKITVLDTSPKYKLVILGAECMTETSAELDNAEGYTTANPKLSGIYDTALRTLKNCMQEVFEDGPKRDRRLWMGDFRVQALSNYVSYRNNGLVKRCLYLFGGSRFPDGRIAACLFTKPTVAADDTFLFDYALLYPVALEEYLQHTDDREALDDLYEIAMQQIEMALQMCDENHIVTRQAAESTFVDWCEGLDKSACAQAVIIYAISYALRLAGRKNDHGRYRFLSEQSEALTQTARERFWSEEKQCFVSNGQISLASQIWMVLANVPAPNETADLMDRGEEFSREFPLQTPYIHHYYVMALLRAGRKEQALAHLQEYWGSMLDAGADTFWETWDPADPDASPYGGSVINSYCHAWSCTPVYLLKSYFSGKEKVLSDE